MHANFRERVRFAGASCQLSGELAYPASAEPVICALVIGPHPYMGGTMQNALVAAIADAITTAGGVSLRFDYGGTGESAGPAIDVATSMTQFWNTGHAPEDPDRFRDAACAMSYCKSLAVQPLAIVGYSFGAAAAWKLYLNNRDSFAAIALLSPTIARHDFPIPPIQALPLQMMVIHSRDDFCTPHRQVTEWTRCLPFPVEYRCHEAGNHFFRGREREIGKCVAAFVAPGTEVVAC